MSEFVENCRRLIGLDSTPRHGCVEAARFVAELCDEAGLEVEIDEETSQGVPQANVIARAGGGARDEELMLQTHLDTPDPGNFTLWSKTQSNPFNASIYGDDIYGLGAANVKLDFLCKLEAIRRFREKTLKRPLVLVGTYGAHSAMAGAIKLLRRKKVFAKKAVIGEPTDLRLMGGVLGLATVELSIPFSREEQRYREEHDTLESGSTQSRMFSGLGDHGATTSLSDNAIVKMLEYLTQMPEGIAVMDLDGGTNYNAPPASAVLEVDVVAGFRDTIVPKLMHVLSLLRRLEGQMRAVQDLNFSPPHATMNIGLIRTFPDQVRLIGSCRLPPTVSDGQYRGWMASFLASCNEVGAQFRVRDYKAGYFIDPEGEMMRQGQSILSEMGLNSVPSPVIASTEASVFNRLGIECLVFGPGRSVGNSHTPNESVSMNDLRRATEFYGRLIESYCL